MTSSKSAGAGSLPARAPANPLADLGDYELRHLVVHLAAAGDGEQLRRLLALEWTGGAGPPAARRGRRIWRRLRRDRAAQRERYHNAWQDAKEAHGLTDSYAGDLAVALGAAVAAADRELARDGLAPSLGLEVRYALMATSLNEFAGRVPPQMAAALVAKRVWTPIQGALYARRITETKRRAEVLIALVPELDGSLRDQVAEQAIEDVRQLPESSRKFHLTPLVPHLSPAQTRKLATTFATGEDAPAILAAASARLAALGFAGEALELAAKVEHERDRANALIAMAPGLDAAGCARAGAMARGIEFEPWRCEALAALDARALAFDDAATALDAIDRLSYARADALARAGDYATGAVRDAVLERIRALEDPEARATALAAFARSAPEPTRSVVLDELLVLLPEMWEHPRGKLLVELAPLLDGVRLERGLALAEGSPDAAFALARRLPESQRTAVVARVRKGSGSLAALIPAGWAALEPAEALKAAMAAGNREAALGDIARDLPPELLSRALAAVLAVRDETLEVRTRGGQEPGRAVARLVGELAAFAPEEALERIRATADETFRSEALIAAAPGLPDRFAGAALTAALGIRSQEPRAKALGALASRLPPDDRMSALAATKARWDRVWSDTVKAFAPHLREFELERALELVEGLQNDAWRGWGIAGLAPWLPAWLLDRALELARGVGNAYSRAAAIRALAARLAACGRGSEALATVETTWFGLVGEPPPSPNEWAEEALSELAASIDGAELPHAYTLATDGGLPRAQAALAGALEPDERAGVVAELLEQALSAEVPRADVLASLARWLDPAELLTTIERAPSRDLVVACAPYLPPSLIAAVATAVAGLREEDRRASLVALARRASPEERPSLISQAFAAAIERASVVSMEEVGWADDLCGLLRTLSPQASHALISTMLETCSRGSRLTLFGVVRGLAPELAHLGGPATLREAAAAVMDTVRWWL